VLLTHLDVNYLTRLFIAGNKVECEDLSATTSVESDDEPQSPKRPRKKTQLADFTSDVGMYRTGHSSKTQSLCGVGCIGAGARYCRHGPT